MRTWVRVAWIWRQAVEAGPQAVVGLVDQVDGGVVVARVVEGGQEAATAYGIPLVQEHPSYL